MNTKLKAILGLTAGALILASSASQAAFQMKLDDGAGNMITVVDGGPNDSSGVAGDGVITFNGSLGGTTTWTVNVTTGLSYPLIGSVTSPKLDLNSVNVSSSGAGTLEIQLSQTDFDMGTMATWISSDVGGTVDNVANFQSYLDQNNALFGQTTQLQDYETPVNSSFSDSTFTAVNVNGPFSLTTVATIVHTQSGQVSSFDYEVKVPEPATMAIMGLGLVGLGFASRRRKTS